MGSTLLAGLHQCQVSQSAGFDKAAWAQQSSFPMYGVKLHLLCALSTESHSPTS